MFTTAVFVIFIRSVLSCEEPRRCNGTSSLPNTRLLGQAFKVQKTDSTRDCIDICDQQTQCRSINFNWVDFLCELNKVDVHVAPQKLFPAKEYVYLDNPWPKIQLKSCAQIQQLVPDAKSAYYWVHIKGKKTEVYCDMDNYGGGWTLVASISSSSNNHLLRAEVNCFNATRCVEFTKTSISCRKLADQDIHEIATHEGTFRVDQVTNGYVGFFQIPAGARMFNSECHTYSCPRIITSHVYPYQWESNCRGIRNGYFIVRQSCYRVFDMHDNGECGETWSSSSYKSKRVLYGYPCHSLGIYRNKAGLLFVK